MAVVGEQDINELKEDDAFFGFPVDARLGCFCDLETQDFYNIYDDFFAEEFKKNSIDKNDRSTGYWRLVEFLLAK
jgi:hypothetical protein